MFDNVLHWNSIVFDRSVVVFVVGRLMPRYVRLADHSFDDEVTWDRLCFCDGSCSSEEHIRLLDWYGVSFIDIKHGRSVHTGLMRTWLGFEWVLALTQRHGHCVVVGALGYWLEVVNLVLERRRILHEWERLEWLGLVSLTGCSNLVACLHKICRLWLIHDWRDFEF